MNQSTKFCVFCGDAPEGKNKEHVLPRWLIDLTGDPKRKAFFGLDYTKQPMSMRSFSFDAFAFPACGRCNQEFSDFENAAKAVVLKMLSNSDLCCQDFSILMDWLDKVRQGLWLGFFYLDKNRFNLRRNHHIRGRICLRDRAELLFD